MGRIAYDGASVHGWQRQKDVPSVQEYLEKALSVIANKPISVFCAGRTDAGVHATGQVVHFDCDVERPERAWTLGVNANMPETVSVVWAKPVVEDFHARFSATYRRYRYVIHNARLRPAIFHYGVTHVHHQLDESRMHEAAQALVGKHDFTTFRASLCQSKSPVRTVSSVEVSRHGRYIVIDIQANAFLHHMVRNITGSLVKIGLNEAPIDWIAHLLTLKDRKKAATTALPNGLYLVDVGYPDTFDIPKPPLGPLFLPEK